MKPADHRKGRVPLVAAGLLLVALPAALFAQHEDRRRAVGGWLVEDVINEDAGRTLRLTREEGDYSLDYHMNLRAGATAIDSQGFMVWRLTCGQGGEESLGGGRAAVRPAQLRERLADYLGRCDTPATEARALLQEFDRAFALLSSWAQESEAEAAVMAEAGVAAGSAIDDMAVDMNAATDMSMDMNMATDMNVHDESDMTWTNSTDPGLRH